MPYTGALPFQIAGHTWEIWNDNVLITYWSNNEPHVTTCFGGNMSDFDGDSDSDGWVYTGYPDDCPGDDRLYAVVWGDETDQSEEGEILAHIARCSRCFRVQEEFQTLVRGMNRILCSEGRKILEAQIYPFPQHSVVSGYDPDSSGDSAPDAPADPSSDPDTTS